MSKVSPLFITMFRRVWVSPKFRHSYLKKGLLEIKQHRKTTLFLKNALLTMFRFNYSETLSSNDLNFFRNIYFISLCYNNTLETSKKRNPAQSPPYLLKER